MDIHDEITIPGQEAPPRRDPRLAGWQPGVARGKGPDAWWPTLPAPGHGTGAVGKGPQPGDQHRHRQRQVPGLPGAHPAPPGHPSQRHGHRHLPHQGPGPGPGGPLAGPGRGRRAGPRRHQPDRRRRARPHRAEADPAAHPPGVDDPRRDPAVADGLLGAPLRPAAAAP